MADREKLIELLKAADRYEFEETRNSGVYDREASWGYIADYLFANGVTIASEKPRQRPKGWQPLGAKSFIEYCPTCKNDGSDLCDLCVMEIKSGYDPKDTVMNTDLALPEPPKEE